PRDADAAVGPHHADPSGLAYGPEAGGHGSDAAAGPRDADAAVGPHHADPSGLAYGPEAGGHGSDADAGPRDADAAVGPHHADPSGLAYGPEAGGHGSDAAAAAGPTGPDVNASAHGGHPGASPDGSRPADGPYTHVSGGDAEAATEAAAGSGTATDGSEGAEEAAEGPSGRAAGPGGAAETGSRPEAAEDPVTDRAPTAGRERMPEPDREHGQEPGEEPRPESAADAVAEDAAVPVAAGPAGDGPEAADAADGRTGGDGADAEGAVADGADAEGAVADGAREPSPAAGPQEEHPLASYVLRVNGADRPVTDAWIGESLLYVLRERLGLAGAKDGCSQGECGACNVQVDGRLVASCLVPSVTAAGSEVRTVEGLATDGQPSDVQRALARRGAVQCGFCVPGMAMTVHNLLEGNPAPTELEARQALCGNLCRCSGYRGVLEAVQEVVAEREAHAGAEAQADADSEEPRIPHQAGPGAGGVNPAAFESAPPPGAHDPTGPHDQPPYGDHGDHGTHGRDGGHA
ncbi:2Fe-2S iron-sulfur cluster-binding protein, partial [Streptomyces violaceorubidus]|uniref:(2Fe-2S)-binding protein n=1 Tax=Streptomyces violaceorubidus TaxID=284042 RepID=UPI003D9EFC75